MQITVQGYLTLKAALGRRLYHLQDHPPPTLQDLLNHLQAELGDNVPGLEIDLLRAKLTSEMVLLLNGRHLSHLAHGNRTQLHDGDVVSIFPPIAGG